MNREDYLRPIRALLREIVRVLRFDINITALCQGLMKDRKDSAPQFRDFEFKNFQLMVAKIESDAVRWLQETVPRMYRPSATEFAHALHKVLFMEHIEQYYNRDMWPPDAERPLMFRMASEVPILQHTLIRIFIIGLSKDHPFPPPDTLELADQLLKRAAAQYSPPLLAIANLYWKAWIMLLILSAHNPNTFGSVAWEKYPTLRTLMEMCITK
ncbi:Integrator complex subunit 1 [Blattella germanica]|nr:Integrator complex subunit 1 [Blattella germanica]